MGPIWTALPSATAFERTTLLGCFDSCGDERGDRGQLQRFIEWDPSREVRGSLRLVAKRPGTNRDLIAEPDVMQPDSLAHDVHHITEHGTPSIQCHHKPGLFEELANHRLLRVLAVIDTPARQRPGARKVGESTGARQQNAAIGYRDTVGRDPLRIDEFWHSGSLAQNLQPDRTVRAAGRYGFASTLGESRTETQRCRYASWGPNPANMSAWDSSGAERPLSSTPVTLVTTNCFTSSRR